MQIYECQCYREYLYTWILNQPKKGRGLAGSLAKHLGVHTSFISLVLHKKKDLSLEQGLKVSEWMSLGNLEKDYFLTLLQENRAGTHSLAIYYREKLEVLKQEFLRIESKMQNVRKVGSKEKTRFYSDPIYSQIRLLVSLPTINSPLDLAKHLKLSVSEISKRVAFLVESGLIQKDEYGALDIGTSITFLTETDPLVFVHHRNWRTKVLDFHPNMGEESMAFTAPLSLSNQDQLEFKSKFLELIGELKERVADSPAERCVIFNLDWVQFGE